MTIRQLCLGKPPSEMWDRLSPASRLHVNALPRDIVEIISIGREGEWGGGRGESHHKQLSWPRLSPYRNLLGRCLDYNFACRRSDVTPM